MNDLPATQSPEAIKACCAALYESDWASLLLGETFHPGGLALTERLGCLLDLQPHQRVLDVATGKGAAASFLAQRFGCQVIGTDYSLASVTAAQQALTGTGVADRVCFGQGDAERLPFANATFDAIICECAFCTFPNKSAAAAEFARVLRPGGRLGLSDLTRAGTLPQELNGLLAWISCIADAWPLQDYVACFQDAGFWIETTEPHDEALLEMAEKVRHRLLAAELFLALKKTVLPGVDLREAHEVARYAVSSIRQGKLGYALLKAFSS